MIHGNVSLVPNHTLDPSAADGDPCNLALQDSTRGISLDDRNRPGLLESDRDQVAHSIQRKVAGPGPAGRENLAERQCAVGGRDGKHGQGVRRRCGVVERQVAAIRD